MPRYRLPRRQVLASLGVAPVISLLSPRAHAIAGPRDAAEPPAVGSEWVLTIALNLRLATSAAAAQGSAVIVGGEATGPLLSGVVLPGSMQWSLDTGHTVLRWAAHYELEAAATRIRVADRATLPASTAGYWNTFSTAPELELISGPAVFGNTLYVGRMDARELGAGRLRMNVHRIL